ncbi:MAG: glucose-1-phosphate cytidylyltransferase [Limisphaerales bacterium]
MKVVILCGGKGTRLREETEFRPKPMVPIGSQPILWHIMKYYSHFGHRDFVLCLGYKGEMIKDYFRNYLWNRCDVTVSLGRRNECRFHAHHDEEDWTVTLADTGPESQTAYRLKLVQKYLDPGKTFLLTYGDGLSTIDLNAAINEHARFGRKVTISAVHPSGRFGALTLGKDGQIHTFQEKPRAEVGYVNGGYMVCEPGVFDYLPDDPTCAFEREPIRRLVDDGQLHSFRHEGWWQPMDTYQESQHLNQLWESGTAPWKVW